jgi:imidazole glycerol phosphate synthase glutamine amidotransferase subunit
MTRVTIVRTGTANLASIAAALRRAGADVTVDTDPDAVRRAPAVVLPGVGSFAAAREALDARGLVAPLRERIAAGRPTLAICLGLQLLAGGSDESPGTPGLAVVPPRVGRFATDLPVPQLGWNVVEPEAGCDLVQPGYAYFANTYRLTERPDGWSAAWTTYGERFVAALQRDAVLACQFHPELSGAWGAALLGRWLARTREAVPC